MPLAAEPAIRHMRTALRRNWRVLSAIVNDTGSNETAGDVRVLRPYGPGQNRSGFSPAFG